MPITFEKQQSRIRLGFSFLANILKKLATIRNDSNHACAYLATSCWGLEGEGHIRWFHNPTGVGRSHRIGRDGDPVLEAFIAALERVRRLWRTT